MHRFSAAFLLVGLSTLGCSLSSDRSTSRVTIHIPGEQSSKFELFPGTSLNQSSFSAQPPSASSGFDCLVVNVVGPGIAPSVGNFGQIELLPSLLNGGHCTYPGISAIVPNTAANSQVTLKVPSGPKRLIQVGGVVEGTSNMCDLPSIQPPNTGTGLAFYELGRAMIDIFRDATAGVEETYNQADSTAQAQRLMTCSTSGAAYTSLIRSHANLVSYWPLTETSGTTAADLQYGVNAAAIGPMTLTNVTFTDGPAGIGLGAMHAGQNGIAANAGTSFGTGDFSVEFWVRYTGACQDGTGSLFVIRHSGAALITFRCNPSNLLVFAVQDNTGPSGTATSINGPVNDGTWHHIVGVKQGNSLSIYDNAGSPGTGSATFIGNFNFTVSPKTQIGQDTVFGEYQTADYAQVAVYNTALPLSTITDHFLAGD